MISRLDAAAIPQDLGGFYDDVALRVPSLQHIMYRNPNSQLRFWRVIDYAKETTPARFCLELGCSEGMMTAELARTFAHVDAVEISRAMLDRCVSLPGVTYHHADANTFEPPMPHYDLVVMSEILEHVEDPVGMLQRYAKIGKRIIATCPVTEPVNGVGAFDATLLGRETRQGDATGHIWYMDMAGFLTWFDGLRVVHSERIGHSGLVICESAT